MTESASASASPALERIDRAITRIETALARDAQVRAAAAARHSALRGKVVEAIAVLDEILTADADA